MQIRSIDERKGEREAVIMKRKNITAITLAAVLALAGLTGCGSSNEEAKERRQII